LHKVDGKPWKATVGRVNELPLDWIGIIVSLAMDESPQKKSMKYDEMLFVLH
jgi:hypothetical protein